jgi:hypothetical protein
MAQSKPVVLVGGNVFDGVSEGLSGSGEILVQDGKIAEEDHSFGAKMEEMFEEDLADSR